MDDELKKAEVLVEVAVLGEQVGQFLNSDVGKYMLNCAREEAEQGLRELRAVDCNDAGAVQAAQNKVYVAESIQAWLGRAVNAGLRALEVLENRDES